MSGRSTVQDPRTAPVRASFTLPPAGENDAVLAGVAPFDHTSTRTSALSGPVVASAVSSSGDSPVNIRPPRPS